MSTVRQYAHEAWYTICRSCASTFLESAYGFYRYGLENIPSEGPCLIVSNHQSYLDPPIVGSCVADRQMFPMARIGLYDIPLLAGLIRSLNTIPIDQSRADSKAIRTALRTLEAGNIVCIFPEGARSPDGSIHTFQRGVGVLLNRSRCPVVPMAIEGAFQAWPRNRAFPHLRGKSIHAMIGEAITHGRLLENGVDAAVRRLEEEVRSLHGKLLKKISNLQ